MTIQRFPIIACFFSFIFVFITPSQNQAMTVPEKDYVPTLFAQYDKFKEPSINYRRFKHRDIVPLIQKLPFEKKVITQSSENRDIYQVKIGNGKTKILLWSQMHGDEPTATMAIFDIFRFFQAQNDGFDDLRKQILNNCTLYFVPMLNPDGAERYQRRTAMEIDMNRDALRLQTPEGKTLKQLQNTLKPEFAFNLHDQNIRTSVGKTAKQATISFLAAAYNEQREWNPVRKRAMQVICHMNKGLQTLIPGHIAKYSDEHEPRAFGDNIQKWGSSLILIESGGYKDDSEKQFIRKLNFVAILSAFQCIANTQYQKYGLKQYNAIPNNDNVLFNILIRNAIIIENGKSTIKDIGINFTEKNIGNATTYITESHIEDLGDLSIFWGIKEIDANGMTVRMMKDYPDIMKKYSLPNSYYDKNTLSKGNEATFVLERNGQIEHVVINGVLK